MQWTVAGKVLSESAIYQKLEALRQDGPTGILLIGADGAVKSDIIGKLWNHLPHITSLHPYGGAETDLKNGLLVLNNFFGTLSADHAARQKALNNFRAAGAKNLVIIWAKYPAAPGWTDSLGQAEDQILRDNPPNHPVELLIEAEELGRQP